MIRRGSRAALLLAACAFLGLSAAPALAQDNTPSGHFVTIAARVCDHYTDIFANRARNNIQESLKDLGPDTNYGDGEWVSREKEGAEPQSRCRPLSNWKFTLGTAIGGKVSGVWGSLSIVSTNSDYDRDITTQDQVTDRDDAGQPSTPIAGAAVIELTQTQYDRAKNASSLWIQGGTPTNPVLDPKLYAFGALRCGGDNLNGDNVEWITFKSNRTYCFAYYVEPPPTSGTIAIKKTVVGEATGSRVFTFEGSISFTPDQTFQLADPASGGIPQQMTFYRAGGSV